MSLCQIHTFRRVGFAARLIGDSGAGRSSAGALFLYLPTIFSADISRDTGPPRVIFGGVTVMLLVGATRCALAAAADRGGARLIMPSARSRWGSRFACSPWPQGRELLPGLGLDGSRARCS